MAPAKNLLYDTAGTEHGWIRSPFGLNVSSRSEEFMTILALQKFQGSGDVVDADASGPNMRKDADGFDKPITAIQMEDFINNIEADETSGEIKMKDAANAALFYTAHNYSTTSVGGNDALNCYWGFCVNDDICPPSLQIPVQSRDAHSSVNDQGMGRVYAEMYDQNQQIMWMQVGVPYFCNIALFTFFSGDANAAEIMKSGSFKSIIGKVLEWAWDATWFAITLPLTAPLWVIRFISEYDSDPVTKAVGFKPAQLLWMEIINAMLSYIAVNLGLYPGVASTATLREANSMVNSKKKYDDLMSPTAEISTERSTDPTKLYADKQYEEYNQAQMNIDGAMAGMTKDENYVKLQERLDKAVKNPDALTELNIPRVLQSGLDIFKILDQRNIQWQLARGKSTIGNTTRSLIKLTGKADVSERIGKLSTTMTNTFDESGFRTKLNSDGTADRAKEPNFFESAVGTALGAKDWIGFRIEKSSQPTENLTNTFGPNAMLEKINEIGQQNRMDAENSAGSKTIEYVSKLYSGNWKNLVAKLGATLSGNSIAQILTSGDGFLDNPEMWRTSNFNRGFNADMCLRARYGDKVSFLQSIAIPMVVIMAAAFPRSVGDSMYTSPFLVKIESKGLVSIPFGAIESVSIRRGASEFGWSVDQLPTSVDISISFRDLSPNVFVGFGGFGLLDVFRRNTGIQSYLDTFTSLSILEKSFMLAKIGRKFNAWLLQKRNTLISPLYWSSKLGFNPGFRMGVDVAFPFIGGNRGSQRYSTYGNRGNTPPSLKAANIFNENKVFKK